MEKPQLIFPILPAYRGKHLWRFRKYGIDYLPRLTSDISTSGGNDLFANWRIHYLGLKAVCSVILRGDYLATEDVRGHYNRLAAGKQLRKFQCFQDPRSYAASNGKNNNKVKDGSASFLQQLSCMFGQKQLPTWASVVSSELARILHHNGSRVIGTIIDDILFHGLRTRGLSRFQKEMTNARKIMKELNLPPNDKGQPPSTKLTFKGITIDTVSGFLSIEEEQRAYVCERIDDIIQSPNNKCRRKELRSLDGSINWLCHVITHGRSRRDCIHQALFSDSPDSDSDNDWIMITAPLRRQLTCTKVVALNYS